MKLHARIALMVGAGVSIYLFIIYGLSRLFGANTGEAFFSFAQFTVDLVLMPLVVITFLVTIYEHTGTVRQKV
jgi:hypothetical protein